jgi:uncharacterized membrane protein
MSKSVIRKTALAGIVAAMYIALVALNAAWSFGPIQFRAAEALTLLPFLFPATIPGLFAGCFIANILSPIQFPFDMVFGSLATLFAAILTSKCKNRWVAAAPPVVINAVVVGILLFLYIPEIFASHGAWALPLNMLSVGFGQLVVCYGLGVPLTFALEKAGLAQKFSLGWNK